MPHFLDLLKAPFCIHPKTARVCIPLVVDAIDDFDPEAVPTLEQLILAAGISSRSAGGDADEAMGEDAPSELWRSTPLRPHIEAFEAFVKGCERETRRSLRAEQDQGAAFTGSW